VPTIAVTGKRYFIRNYHGAISYVVMYPPSDKLDTLQWRNISHLLSHYLESISVQLSNPDEYAKLSLSMILPQVEPGWNRSSARSYTLTCLGSRTAGMNELIYSL
jgi:hypothetical protein